MKHLIAKRVENNNLKTKSVAKKHKKIISQQKKKIQIKEPIADKTYTL